MRNYALRAASEGQRETLDFPVQFFAISLFLKAAFACIRDQGKSALNQLTRLSFPRAIEANMPNDPLDFPVEVPETYSPWTVSTAKTFLFTALYQALCSRCTSASSQSWNSLMGRRWLFDLGATR